MAVVFNTNTAASIASNNLSASTALLQKSLMRLSSGCKIVNASDDAGGVAVAVRLNAAAKRSGVTISNIGNSIAFLQQQDSVFKTMGKMLERMSELQSLTLDATKSTSDLANYASEFNTLRSQLVTIQTTKYNGLNVIGADSNLNVSTSETGESYAISTGITTNIGGYDSLEISGSPGIPGGSAYYKSIRGDNPANASYVSGGSSELHINAIPITFDNDTISSMQEKINAQSGTTHVTVALDSTKTKFVFTSSVTGDNTIDFSGSEAEAMDALGLAGDEAFVNRPGVLLYSGNGTDRIEGVHQVLRPKPGAGYFLSDELAPDDIAIINGVVINLRPTLDPEPVPGHPTIENVRDFFNAKENQTKVHVSIESVSINSSRFVLTSNVSGPNKIIVVASDGAHTGHLGNEFVGFDDGNTEGADIYLVETTAGTLDQIAENPEGSSVDAPSALQAKIDLLSKARAVNGADQSVLGYRAELSTACKANYEAAVSRIIDVDVAEESTQLARWNTLVQAGTAIIAQANASTQSALSLLK